MYPVKLSFIVLSIVSCFAIMAFTENGIGNVCWDTSRHLATNFQMPTSKPQEHHGQTLQMNPAKTKPSPARLESGKPGKPTVSNGSKQFRQMVKKSVNPELSCQPDGVWSGTWDDLNAVVANAEKKHGWGKHLERNATMLIPYSLSDMVMMLSRGNVDKWQIEGEDGYHHPEHKGGMLQAGKLSSHGKWQKIKSLFVMLDHNISNLKFINPMGGEVGYNADTGEMVPVLLLHIIFP